MIRVLAPVAALLIGVSILLTGQGLQGTLLPVRASLEGFPTLAIGAMGATYFLGFTVGCLRGGELVGLPDRDFQPGPIQHLFGQRGIRIY